MKKLFKRYIVFFFLVIALAANVTFWKNSKDVQAQWLNVPPAPDLLSAKMSGLSDAQLSYRANGVMLQNLGSVGGQGINLREYAFRLRLRC